MTSRTKQHLSLATAVQLIVAEDWRNEVYNDIGGLPTIGVGHLLTQSELTSGKIVIAGRGVKWSKGLSDKDVALLFAQDVAEREAILNDQVKASLEQHQFDALFLFVFNIGNSAFANSTLLRKLNDGDYADVPTQLRRWIYAKGKVSNGLKARREHEVAIWNNTL